MFINVFDSSIIPIVCILNFMGIKYKVWNKFFIAMKSDTVRVILVLNNDIYYIIRYSKILFFSLHFTYYKLTHRKIVLKFNVLQIISNYINYKNCFVLDI